jgi:glycosyltransferase involved in cell wall biosynthesis
MPVLSTLHDDIPYVTVPGKSALLAPEGDVEALFKNLRQAVHGSAHWPSMGHSGRAKIEADHDVNKESEILERYYDEACSG